MDEEKYVSKDFPAYCTHVKGSRMHEEKDTGLPSWSTVASSAKEGFPVLGRITNSQAERGQG